MACGSGTLHDPGNETADAGRHGFPDSCGIGVSAGYGIVDCIADSAAASIRSRKEQSSHFEALQAEANASGKKTLKRVLGPWSLVALGVEIGRAHV